MIKKLIIIFSSVLGVGGLGIAGYYVYKHHIYDYRSEVIELVDDFLEDGEYEDIRELKDILRSYAKTDKLEEIRLATLERIELRIDSFYRDSYRNSDDLTDDYNELRGYIDELYEECVVNVEGSTKLLKESKYEELVEDFERVLEEKEEKLNNDENYASSSSGNSNENSSNKENEVHVKEEINNEEFTSLVTISYDEFNSMLEMDIRFLVVVSRTGCSWCTKFEPVLSQTLKDLDMVGYRVDLATFDNEAMEFFNARFAIEGTPTTLIIESGQVVAENVGYLDADPLKTWILNNYE